MLARALVHRPRALILDEPTAGLDIAARFHLLDRLEEIAAAGTSLLLVTHHVEEIIPAIQHAILLDSGRIAFDGVKSEACSSDRLSKLFGVGVEIVVDEKGYLQAVHRRSN